MVIGIHQRIKCVAEVRYIRRLMPLLRRDVFTIARRRQVVTVSFTYSVSHLQFPPVVGNHGLLRSVNQTFVHGFYVCNYIIALLTYFSSIISSRDRALFGIVTLLFELRPELGIPIRVRHLRPVVFIPFMTHPVETVIILFAERVIDFFISNAVPECSSRMSSESYREAFCDYIATQLT